MANHVFISYAREDRAYTRKLADHLRERGFDVWMDDRIDFGDRWWHTIVQALRASAAFVIVMMPEWEKSEWVEREVILAGLVSAGWRGARRSERPLGRLGAGR